MASILTDVHLPHPHPYVRDSLPLDRRIPLSLVAGRLQDVGHFHNAFVNIYNGDQIPPNRLTIVSAIPEQPEEYSEMEFEIDVYGAFIVSFVHHENQGYGQPAMVIFASLTGSAVILEFFRFTGPATSVAETLRKSFPSLYKIMVNQDLQRLTLSYDAVHPFVVQEIGARAGNELVDLLLVASILRSEDFGEFSDLSKPSETFALQILIWSILGRQHGPVPSQTTWEKHPALNDSPWPPERRKLYKFYRDHPLNDGQKIWFYQGLRAGAMIGIQAVHPLVKERDMDLPERKTGVIFSESLAKFRATHSINNQGLMGRITGRPNPASLSSSKTSYADMRKRMASRNAPLQPATPPRPRKPRKESAERSHRSSSQHQRRVNERGDRPHRSPKHQRRSPAKPKPKRRHASHRRRSDRSSDSDEPEPRPGPSSTGSPRRSRPKHRRILDDLDKDRLIKKGRLLFLQRKPVKAGTHPLGAQFCIGCAKTPPCLNEKECVVYLYAKKILTPPHSQFPCISCTSTTHISAACIFTHWRCEDCTFLGHMEFECDELTTEQWLVFFLHYVQLGRGTRRNPEGPMGGRWGFGNTQNIPLVNATRRLIHTKRTSLKNLNEERDEEVNQEAELQASWMALVREQNAHQQELQRSALGIQEDLVRRVAEALEQKREQGRRPQTNAKEKSSKRSATRPTTSQKTSSNTRTSTSTHTVRQSTIVPTQIIVVPATPERRQPEGSDSSETPVDGLLSREEGDEGDISPSEEAALLGEEPMETETSTSTTGNTSGSQSNIGSSTSG